MKPTSPLLLHSLLPLPLSPPPFLPTPVPLPPSPSLPSPLFLNRRKTHQEKIFTSGGNPLHLGDPTSSHASVTAHNLPLRL